MLSGIVVATAVELLHFTYCFLPHNTPQPHETVSGRFLSDVAWLGCVLSCSLSLLSLWCHGPGHIYCSSLAHTTEHCTPCSTALICSLLLSLTFCNPPHSFRILLSKFVRRLGLPLCPDSAFSATQQVPITMAYAQEAKGLVQERGRTPQHAAPRDKSRRWLMDYHSPKDVLPFAGRRHRQEVQEQRERRQGQASSGSGRGQRQTRSRTWGLLVEADAARDSSSTIRTSRRREGQKEGAVSETYLSEYQVGLFPTSPSVFPFLPLSMSMSSFVDPVIRSVCRRLFNVSRSWPSTLLIHLYSN